MAKAGLDIFTKPEEPYRIDLEVVPRMSRNIWIAAAVGVAAALGSYQALAQQPAPGARVIQVPFGNGVYYQGSSGWVSLTMRPLLPTYDGAVREFFIGTRTLKYEMPGQHAALAVSDSKPAFYIRGYHAGSRLLLVRGSEKQDYRKITMDTSRDLKVWGRFRSGDVTEVEAEAIADGVLRVRPRTDLKPGEYVLVSSVDSSFRAIRLAYEFGVATAANR
jgi:hypothetical protein